MRPEKKIYYCILLIGVLIGAVKFQRLSFTSRLIFFFIVYIIAKELIADNIAKLYNFNLHFYQLFAPVDFLFLVYIYWNIVEFNKYRGVLLTICMITISFFFLNIAVLQPLYSGIDSYFKLLRSFFLVLISLLLFHSAVLNLPPHPLHKKSMFWFNIGVLIFYSLSIFYWGLFNYDYIQKERPVINPAIRKMFEIGNYALYSFLAISIWINNFSTLEDNKSSDAKHQ